jgi:hypothetical protein
LERLVKKINEKGPGARDDSALNQDKDKDTNIIKSESDDEEEGSQVIEPQVLETLGGLIPKIHRSLAMAISEPVQMQFQESPLIPLGTQKLRSIELLY